jgi:hypothetical protein
MTDDELRREFAQASRMRLAAFAINCVIWVGVSILLVKMLLP